ncbi:hypothetical protein H0H87_011036 [Tephrocybe sp. NHM501043]|nr:hypothetical protein H0H87_011036 [Tephrocybe sp. NHM501043]
MEIFMHNISFNVTRHRLTTELATILHGSRYSHFSSVPLNFHVHLYKDKKGLHQHSGCGTLTLSSEEIGHQFLSEYGDGSFTGLDCTVSNRRIRFKIGKNAPRPDVLESIARDPYIDPNAAKEQERIERSFREEKVMIKTLQFGWECRDYVFSVEWEQSPDGCHLSFNDERRDLRIRIPRPYDTLAISIRFSNLQTKSVHTTHTREPVIFLTLESPPAFESEPLESDRPRRRLSTLPLTDHAPLSPYVTLALRLVCKSQNDLDVFLTLCKDAKIHHIGDAETLIERRRLFAPSVAEKLERWLRTLNWCIAFQIESLLRNLSIDMTEMLQLMPIIHKLRQSKGKKHVAGLLAYFGPRAMELSWGDASEEKETIVDCFSQAQKDYEAHLSPLSPRIADPSLFEAYHVEVTPTTIRMSGPHPERSNRIIRRYASNNHESFLRVSFVDEGRLHYRFDRDIDGKDFVQARVGTILLNGLSIAGRNFEFLAYSQSALKEHAVWFVKPFRDPLHGYVNAEAIIKSIGSFENLPFDKSLIYCPARYGARISQAFTATDVSITIHPEEVIHEQDFMSKNGKYCFTDGVGTMSREVAIEVSGGLTSLRQHGRNRRGYSRAFQIRFQGSKGMLSIDYTLEGRAICLRPSMIKFEDTTLEIEIARAFDRPGPYFLNRPLIMLLENLGVKYEVFKSFQDKAVRETEQSVESIAKAARMLETYGLGSSYRLPAVMLALAKLDVDDIPNNSFYRQILLCATHHILRLLKNRARIPIPGAWTLVGVADIHKCLQEGEIFACIKPIDGSVIYLEGPVLVSRSPTIHPGDVQIAFAIGRPPDGSCFTREPLFNTVVFSVLGSRPLPSCLGGGDLDGDVYNLIPLNERPEFNQLKTYKPAEYPQAQKKLLDHPSTMGDVAQFVVEYINSDVCEHFSCSEGDSDSRFKVVGIIAINWLIIADQSPEGILDKRCLELARLHSDAVDYPKSGNPVALERIPKLVFPVKPDWNAPETVNADSAKYYKSTRAIGRLFRDITLPLTENLGTRRPRHRRGATVDNLSNAMHGLSITDGRDDDDFLQRVVKERTNEFIDTSRRPPMAVTEMIEGTFERYVSELSAICATCSLSYSRPLTEEEAIMGTIVQKTSQPRLRLDMTAKLRERTDILVCSIREDLMGEDDENLEEHLQRAWLAWKLSIVQRLSMSFGGESFGWVALGAILEAIKDIEAAQLEDSLHRFY